MANTDKNLIITPNIGSSSDDPKITFSGADSSLGAQSLNARIYPTSNGTLSFEGSSGQLFSVTNSLTGTVFSVNDISGLPSIEVLDTGIVRLARYGGRVVIGNVADNGVDSLQFSIGSSISLPTVNSSGNVAASFFIGSGATLSNLNVSNAASGTLATTRGGTGLTSFTANGVVYASNTSALTTGSALTFDGTNLGIGTSSPASKLNVVGTADATFNSQILIGNSSAATQKLAFNPTVSSGIGGLVDGSLAFYANGANTERMRLDASGNLGLGVTPSAQGVYRTMQFGDFLNIGQQTTGTSQAFFGWNVRGSSTANQYLYNRTGDKSALYEIGSDAAHRWYTTSTNGTAGNAISFTQAMTLDASGNLGVGSSPSSFDSAWQRLVIGTGSGDAGQAIYSGSASIGTIAFADGTTGAQQYAGLIRYLHASDAMTFWAGAAERARIDASGNLGIAVTPSAWSNDGNIQLKADRFISGGVGSIRLASNVWFGGAFKYISTGVATFYQQNAGVHSWHYAASGTGGNAFTPLEYARITTTGGFSVGTTSDPGIGAIYATGNITAYFSDERLKTKLGNIENALEKVSSISGFYHEANELAESLGYKKVREVGVSAQEVQKVMPEVVAPAPISDEYLTVRYERLVPLLIEAIKELKAEIETLKKRVN